MDFLTLFQLLHGVLPFPWQSRLAAQAEAQGWPDTLVLPPKSGRTGVLDVWLYTLIRYATCRDQVDAPQRAARRLFFVHDPRAVDVEALHRAERICDRLARARSGTPLREIADRLRELSGSDLPVIFAGLGGGTYFVEDIWSNPAQAAIICGRISEAGSRLLFRGHGVGFRSLSVQAGLMANDSLIVFDEPQFSTATCHTARQVRQIRSEGAHFGPFDVVRISTFPPADAGAVFGLDGDDRQNATLQERLDRPLPTTLVKAKNLVRVLAAEAMRLRRGGAKSVAVVCNHVATARAVTSYLEQRMPSGTEILLLTGNTRGVDRNTHVRDRLTRLTPGSAERPQVFLCTTQTIEAASNLDFDALVTECASLDSVLQRLARVNRLGLRDNGKAVIVMAGRREASADLYDDTQQATWEWLISHSHGPAARRTLNMSVTAVEARQPIPPTLLVACPPPPLLLPPHVNALVQTSPRPAVEPDVTFSIYGEGRPVAEVFVVWRADLTSENRRYWTRIVRLVPPSSAERLAVRLSSFVLWMLQRDGPGTEDVPVQESPFQQNGGPLRTPFVLWRGFETRVVDNLRGLRHGDTIVLPESCGGWGVLGSIVSGTADRAELAQFLVRGIPSVRLDADLLATWPDAVDLLLLINAGNYTVPAIRAALDTCVPPAWLLPVVNRLRTTASHRIFWHPYRPMLVGRRIDAEGADLRGVKEDEVPVSQRLLDHCNDVGRLAAAFARLVGVSQPQVADLELAGREHDTGMMDPRFQALLQGGIRSVMELIARSGVDPRNVSPAAFGQSQYPPGQRHEVQSVAILLQHPALLTTANDRDLVLHLVESHHGRCCPLAPVVPDRHSVAIDVHNWRGVHIQASSDPDLDSIGSGIADRFWRMVGRYGPWGLAFLRAILACAERRRSRLEVGVFDEQPDPELSPEPGEPPVMETPPPGGESVDRTDPPATSGPTIMLSGLRGSIPLAFLAACGTLSVLRKRGLDVRLSWQKRGDWTPVLHTPVSQRALVAELLAGLKVPPPVAGLQGTFKLTAAECREFGVQHPQWSCTFFATVPVADREEPAQVRRSSWVLIEKRIVDILLALAAGITTMKIECALFTDWDSENRDEKYPLNLDPSEHQVHAAQWTDPSTSGSFSRHAPNLLSLWALAEFFHTFPTAQGGASVGFRGDTVSWPIWEEALGVGEIRTLVNLSEIQGDIDRRALARRGVMEVFRSRRFEVGKYGRAYLTPSAPA